MRTNKLIENVTTHEEDITRIFKILNPNKSHSWDNLSIRGDSRFNFFTKDVRLVSSTNPPPTHRGHTEKIDVKKENLD